MEYPNIGSLALVVLLLVLYAFLRNLRLQFLFNCHMQSGQGRKSRVRRMLCENNKLFNATLIINCLRPPPLSMWTRDLLALTLCDKHLSIKVTTFGTSRNCIAAIYQRRTRWVLCLGFFLQESGSATDSRR